MKKFLTELIIFFIILMFLLSLIPLIELLLPVSFFTYRSWEALHYKNMSFSEFGPFYPCETIIMQEQGDLGHHTKFARHKNICWRTDSIGFRNDRFISDPDVLLIGDSFFAGSGLSQSETITSQIIRKGNGSFKIYNLSPGSMTLFDRLFHEKVIGKPKTIIYSISERNIPAKFIPYINVSEKKGFINEFINKNSLNILADRLTRLYSVEWIKSRLRNSRGQGISSPLNHEVLFLQGRKVIDFESEKKLNQTCDALKSYKTYCDSLGIDFLFLPMPNKESVYFDYVTLKSQPLYLFKLDSALKLNAINSFNTIKTYNAFRKKSVKNLYHPDDTHWNSNATELIADSIIVYLQKNIPNKE